MADQCFSNVLVTGGCGFIPSHFTNYILEQVKSGSIGTVINYDRLTLASNKANVISSHLTSQQYVLVTGDICNRKLLDQTLHKYKNTLCCSNTHSLLHWQDARSWKQHH